MKKIFVFLTAFLITLSSDIYVRAIEFETVNVSVDSKTEAIVIDGCVTSKRSGVDVTVWVIGPAEYSNEDTPEQIEEKYIAKANETASDMNAFADYVEYAGQEKSGADGVFALSAPITSGSDYYLVMVSSMDSAAPYYELVKFHNKNYYDGICRRINLASTHTEISDILDKEVYEINMEADLYRTVSESGLDMEKFYTGFLNKNFASFGALMEYYAYNLAGFALESNNYPLFEKALNDYTNELGIKDLKTSDKFSAMPLTEKEQVCRQITKETGTYAQRFAKSVFITGFRKLTQKGQVKDFIEGHNDSLLDLTKYKGNTDLFDSKLILGVYKGKNFLDCFTDFKAAFEKIVASPQNGEGTVTPSDNGGIGGGGGSVISNPLAESTINVSMFDDISESHWAAEAISELYKKGIISGVGDRIFAPDENVSREQFAKMLVSMLEIEIVRGNLDFMDVKTGEWYYDYVYTAYINGIVSGKGNGAFGTGESITREDMAAMAFRAAEGLTGSNFTYTDMHEISDYAKNAVGAMSANGILSGFEDNSFRPKAYATRAQAANMIYGLYNAMKQLRRQS